MRPHIEEALKRLQEECSCDGVITHLGESPFKHSSQVFKETLNRGTGHGVTISANCFLLARETNNT